MFNKAALSSYNFPSANVITLLQVCNFTTFFFLYFMLVILYPKFTSYMLCGVKEMFDIGSLQFMLDKDVAEHI